MQTSFERAIAALPVQTPISPVVARTLAALHAFIDQKEWRGACHVSTAVAHILLTEQDVLSAPCIGDVQLDPGLPPGDHSWLEVGDHVCDLAIAYPLQPEFALAPVIAGHHLDDGRPTRVLYGFHTTKPAPYRAILQEQSLSRYLDGSGSGEVDAWEVVISLGRTLGLDLNLEILRRRYASSRWAKRPEPEKKIKRFEDWFSLPVLALGTYRVLNLGVVEATVATIRNARFEGISPEARPDDARMKAPLCWVTVDLNCKSRQLRLHPDFGMLGVQMFRTAGSLQARGQSLLPFDYQFGTADDGAFIVPA